MGGWSPPGTANPSGDGLAARRSAEAVAWSLGRVARPAAWTS